MKLWLLRPVENLERTRDAWLPCYDKIFGFVIRAESEAAARALADANGRYENTELKGIGVRPWLDRGTSTCVELTADGPREVVIADKHNG